MNFKILINEKNGEVFPPKKLPIKPYIFIVLILIQCIKISLNCYLNSMHITIGKKN